VVGSPLRAKAIHAELILVASARAAVLVPAQRDFSTLSNAKGISSAWCARRAGSVSDSQVK